MRGIARCKRIWWPRIMLARGPVCFRKNGSSNGSKKRRESITSAPQAGSCFRSGLDRRVTRSCDDHFGNALKLDKSQMGDNRFDKAPKWAEAIPVPPWFISRSGLPLCS